MHHQEILCHPHPLLRLSPCAGGGQIHWGGRRRASRGGSRPPSPMTWLHPSSSPSWWWTGSWRHLCLISSGELIAGDPLLQFWNRVRATGGILSLDVVGCRAHCQSIGDGVPTVEKIDGHCHVHRTFLVLLTITMDTSTRVRSYRRHMRQIRRPSPRANLRICYGSMGTPHRRWSPSGRRRGAWIRWSSGVSGPTMAWTCGEEGEKGK